MSVSTSERVGLRGIVKTFGDLVAVDSASLSIERGEVHALVGENGAGKSTLMNILYGLLQCDAGEVMVDGRPVTFAGPAEAIAHGIGMVHQHFKLAPSFSIAENIILGSEPVTVWRRLDREEAVRRVAALGARFGFDTDPRAIVGTLPVGLQQRVEIMKALYREAQILILDEPTSVLTPQETRELFATMRALAADGHSIVFITHKLAEVLAVADRISVMRHGQVIATRDNQGVTAEELARLMVGRPVLLHVVRNPAHPGPDAALAVRRLTVAGDRGETAVDGVSFTVHPGEIVGLAGVQGNGQDELVQSIAGLRRPVFGEIAIAGAAVAPADPRASRAAGLAYIPADRGRVGLSRRSTVWENMTMGHQREFARGPFFGARAARHTAAGLIRRFDVRGAGVETTAASLSGGNQQKVQLARELMRDAPMILAEQPSQGVDIGAIEAIHRILVEMRDAGRAVFVVSADLEEIFSLCDRILVIYRGRIVADLATASTDFEQVGRYMGGLHEHAAAAGSAGAEEVRP